MLKYYTNVDIMKVIVCLTTITVTCNIILILAKPATFGLGGLMCGRLLFMPKHLIDSDRCHIYIYHHLLQFIILAVVRLKIET